MTSSPIAIGLDVGGTKIAAGLVRRHDGAVLARRLRPTHPPRGGPVVLDDCVAMAEELRDQALRDGSRIAAIGIGVAELVDHESHVVSEQTLAWSGVPVAERFAHLAPALLEADSRAAALAEARFGAGRGLRSFFYVTVGTGIGSAFVIDGRPWRGARGATGTLATAHQSFTCRHCGSLEQPVLEQIASGPALVERVRARGRAVAGAEDVVALAAEGDDAACAVIESATRALGSALGLVVNVLDPEGVIVGGGLGSADGPYWNGLVAATHAHVWSTTHHDLPMRRALLGADAGLVGAALFALDAGSGDC